MTIDHISGGRAMMVMGGAWFEREHRAFGLDFGSGFGERLDWLDEAVAAPYAARRRGRHQPGRGAYAFDHLRIEPRRSGRMSRS